MAELLRDQFNVIARWQAKRYGLDDARLRRRLRPDGPWQKVLPGVYVTETGTVTTEQRHMAALLFAGQGAVITGAAAVRRHRRAFAGGNDVEVLVPMSSRVQGHGYVRVQRTSRMPSTALSIRNLMFAPLARAVADAARAMLKPEDIRALVSEALQKGFGCTLEDLMKELRAGPAAGSGLFRAALAELASGVRFEAERNLKTCIDRSDLPRPMYNVRLYLPDGTFLAMTDAWWPDAGVAGEADSVQYHTSARDYERTLQRRNRMEAAGIRVLQFLPRDIKPKWPTYYREIQSALAHGASGPPPRIIAVPADIKDVKEYLAAYPAVPQPA
jgi:hypothetical protein